MDWLTLGLVLLAVASNIEAQQGYNYPKPKIAFPGVVSTNANLGSQPDLGGGTQRSFGTQQPSGVAQPGVASGTQRPFGSQLPSGGYSNGGQAATPSGTSGTFGTQQPSGGYSVTGQTGTPSGISGTFGTQQPSNGVQIGTPSGAQGSFGSYSVTGPSGTSGVTSGTFGTSTGTQQPSGGYPGGETQPGISGSTQGSFGTQQPSAGYPTQAGTSSGIQRPFGTQGQSGQPGSFGSQQPSTTYPGQSVFGVTQRPLTQLPGRSDAGRQLDSQDLVDPTIDLSKPSVIGRPQGQGITGPSQQGYNYPSPQKSFSGTGQISTTGTGIAAVSRPDNAGTGTFGLAQGPSVSPSAGRPLGSQNGYTSPGLERPTGQFPSVSSRPLGTGQQQVGAYPEVRRPQGSFPSVTGSQYPLGNGQSQVLPDKRGRAEFSEEGRLTSGFPAGQGGYAGSEESRQPSAGVTQPSGPLGGQGHQSQKPASSQFPSGGSAQISGPSERPGFAGRTAATQFPSSGIQGQTEPLDRQRPSGYPSTTTSGQTSIVSGPSRPQLPSITSQDKTSSTGYQSYLPPEQPGTGGLPLAEVSPSRFPSDGFIPTDSRPQTGYGSIGGSQRPSGAVEQAIRPQNGYSGPDVSTVSQRPSTGQFAQPQTGYGRPDVLTGSQRPSGAAEQPTQSQNGYGRPDISTGSERPSTGQTTQSQTGYGRPEVSTGSHPSSGARGQPSLPQNEYNRPDISTGSLRPSTGQSTQSQTGYVRPDISTGAVSNGRRPSVSDTTSKFPQPPASSQIGYGTSGITLPGSQFPSGVSGQPTRTQNGQDVSVTPSGRRPFEPATTDGQTGSGSEQGTGGFGKPSTQEQFTRPGSAGRSEPGYSLDQAVQEGFPRRTGGRTLPGFQQDARAFIPSRQGPSDDGAYEEEDEGDFSAIPGQPGRDYPILSDVPETSFTCDDQEFRGYYADVETRCQIFHICANNKTYDFICPNGTVFHQENLVCVWWNQFDCETAPSLYRINEHIYDFSIFGAQQTGGIPFPGQEFPEFQGEQQGFPLGRTTSAGVAGQGAQGGGLGQSRYPGQRPASPRTEDRYPSEVPQGQGGVSQPPTGPGGVQQGTGSYQAPSGAFQRPGGYQRPSGELQRPGGYPSEGPQGASYPSSTEYPSRTPQETGTYQAPNGQSQGGIGLQRPAGTGQYQSLSGGYQRPGSGIQRPGEQPQGSTESSLTGYPSVRPGSSGREPQSQGFPTGPESSLEQRPGQYGRGGKSRTFLPLGSQTTAAPGGQQPGGDSRPQQPSGYSTGVSPRPGSPQSSVPSQGSPFPGSPQPHQSTREYLPPV